MAKIISVILAIMLILTTWLLINTTIQKNIAQQVLYIQKQEAGDYKLLTLNLVKTMDLQTLKQTLTKLFPRNTLNQKDNKLMISKICLEIKDGKVLKFCKNKL